ncbi:MAG: hypothetical protein ABR955_05315 [Verrucomicrobiota bacterium]|jgi:hypothetical protein
MKITKYVCLASCCFILTNQCKAQSLYDNFSGTSVNTSLWDVVLPFGQSQVTESGGFLTTTGRGILATAAGFNAPYTVSGSVIMNNINEHFQVALGTDLSINNTPDGQFYQVTGVVIQLAVC